MKRGQATTALLLAIIAALLGVVFFLLVRPSVETATLGNGIEAEAPPETPVAGENAPAANPIDAIVDNVIASDAPATEAPQIQFSAIPRQFWGSWTQHPERCGQDDADDTLLDIAPKTVRFWESSGAVETVTLQNPMTIDVTAAFSGEGEQWESTTTYALSGSRQKLLISSRGAAPVWYQRCPAPETPPAPPPAP